MIRSVRPELLDRLHPDDPAVPHARRDLRLINTLMGNHRWVLRQLKPHLRSGDQVAEWGGGDGSLARMIVGRYSRTRDFSLTVIDQALRPTGLPGSVSWVSRDLLDFGLPLPEADIVIANLILHHFEKDQLAQLGTLLKARCRMLIACEPARRRRHQWQVKGLSLLGLHAVTRHDAHVSIGAGFRRTELARCLNLEPQAWNLSIQETALGAHRLLAIRR